jgi:hypothetical protein
MNNFVDSCGVLMRVLETDKVCSDQDDQMYKALWDRLVGYSLQYQIITSSSV